MTDDALKQELAALDALSRHKAQLFDKLDREDMLGLECEDTVEHEQVKSELMCRAAVLLPEIRRLMAERDLWKERAETWLEQEMMSPGEWKLHQAIVKAAVEWAHTPAPGDLGPLLDAINDWQDAEALDRKL